MYFERVGMTKLMFTTARVKAGASRVAALLCGIAMMSAPAMAQDAAVKSNSWSTQTLTLAPQKLDLEIKNLEGLAGFKGPEGITKTIGDAAPMNDSIFDLTGNDKAALFNLDEGGTLCLRTTEECAANDDSFGLGIQGDFAKDGSRGIGMALQPRAGVSFDDDSSSALVGALVKIGDNLQNAENIDPNTWYFFAGADAQAMTYTPGRETLDGAGRFALRDSVIVGDAQAGVAYRLGAADVSLTYLRREARAENYKFEEDAAALSFTWRR